MFEYMSVMFLQMMFVLIRFVNVRHIMGESLRSRLIITLVANLVWILTLSVGVKSMIEGDYIIIVFFLLGSTFGVLIEDKLRKYL